ncbi:hypothetical protein LOD99_11992 [Oopsacas minuta]|uniref:Uncharacterized protein n=1 Tax=Oopsacas minuta TaxID=111878 RepID=A0AAV7JHA2_9METZ|nr:hypothetical protein LOD99_11992 [Oopsacas minuta]
MMHGLCFIANVTEGAIKNFPKPSLPVTNTGEDGYLAYRRRDKGRVVNVDGVKLVNSECINICNGHDKAIVEFRSGGEDVDAAVSKSLNEVSEYLEGMYVSAP